MRSQLQHRRAFAWPPHSQHKQGHLSLAGHQICLPPARLLHFLPQRTGKHPLRRLRDPVANLPQLDLPLDLLIPHRLVIHPGILFALIHSLPSHRTRLLCHRFTPVPLYRRSRHAWPEHFS